MKLLISGDGPRMDAARDCALRRGHSLPEHGPWDAVLLKLPRSEVSEDEADLLPRGQHVICGQTDAAFDCLAARRGWRLHRILEDDTFAKENALLTAEGALYAAMSARDAAIRGSHCIVIGYGRIGRALTKLLRGLDARVTVAARRPESRKEAGGGIPLTLLSRAFQEADVVFNTVPAPILTESRLSFLPASSLYIELAGPPYGLQPEKAKKAHAAYLLESGVPARYCPRSAGRLLIEYVERTVNAP